MNDSIAQDGSRSVTGRSIVVTGGASGIGEATTRLLAADGAHVTVADLSDEAGEALVDELRAEGLTAQYIHTDIASEDDVAAMVGIAVSTYGRLDAAFNNAGRPPVGKLLADLTEEEFRRCGDVNTVGTFLSMKHELIAMLESGGGAIVNNASINGFVHSPNATEYIATKHAIVGMTKAVAVDYATHGIRVNAIAPSATRTPMYLGYIEQNPDYGRQIDALHPLGRASEPREQAQAAAWLLSEAASYVTGVTLLVDGGYTAV